MKRVPVVNRRSDAKTKPALKKRNSLRVGTMEIIVVAAVLIVFLVTISVPLRNYFDQRNEIRATSAAIAQKQKHKEELISELERYQNKAYLDEQARNRLGVIAPGEVPFRILDPSMNKDDALTTIHAQDSAPTLPWYETLWSSVAHPAPVVTGEEPPAPAPEMKMPVKPTPVQP